MEVFFSAVNPNYIYGYLKGGHVLGDVGIATALLNFCFDIPDYIDYYIKGLSKNTNAKRFYEKTGFKVYKEQRFHRFHCKDTDIRLR